MRLTRERAIKLSIELWEWLAESGGEKGEWPEASKYWGDGEQRYCPLCDYDNQFAGASCSHCPIVKVYEDGCHSVAFGHWTKAKTPEKRKKYAKLFLEQLRTLEV